MATDSTPLLSPEGGRPVPIELVEEQAKSGNNLGTFRGVYVPCVLSIFGVVLFLRLGWSVGNVGLWQTLIIMGIAGLVDVFTILSVSAISTTGRIKGGGPYYLISRALGPAFGGSAGIAFFLANAIGVTFYLTGFVETLVSSSGLFFWSCYWTEFFMGSAILLVVTSIALIGANAYALIASVILLFKISSIIIGFLAFLIRNPETADVPGFYGLHNVTETFVRNWSPYDGDPGPFANFSATASICGEPEGGGGDGGPVDFFQAFGILFPAFTGIMAGANMSGDLRNPGKSIYSGSVYGMLTALVVYLSLIMAQACTVDQRILAQDANIMQRVAWKWWLVGTGIFCSTFASAMASIVGASRILQALARDKLIRVLDIFGYGSPGKDEPRVAILATWFVAQCALFAGNLNAIAPILSMFFLLTYTIINLAVFVLAVSGTPNFRPSFNYFSWHTALLGALSSIVVMFLLNPYAAAIAIAFMLFIFVSISYFGPAAEWGEVSQAIIYHQVRKYLLRLDLRKEHVKNWRPGVLMLVHGDLNDKEVGNIVFFANELKKGGLFVLGKVVEGDDDSFGGRMVAGQNCRTIKHEWLQLVDKLNVKAFVEVIASANSRDGVFSLMQTCGLGGMTPNTLFLPYDHKAIVSSNDFAIEFVSNMRDAQALGKNVVVARGFERLDREKISSEMGRLAVFKKKDRQYIDVWPIECWGEEYATETTFQSSLLLQLANILHSHQFWNRHSRLRVCTFTLLSDDTEVEKLRIQQWLTKYRIVAEVAVFSLEELELSIEKPKLSRRRSALGHLSDPTEKASIINAVVKHASSNTVLQFVNMPLPLPTDSSAHVEYTQMLDTLTTDLPPIALVLAEQDVITNDI